MKKSIIIILATIAFFSCKKEKEGAFISGSSHAPSITVPQENATFTVTEINGDENVWIRWEKADYGVSTVLNYTVQADLAGGDFSSPLLLGSTQDDSVAITMATLNNQLLNNFNVPANTSADIQIRVTASINGTNTVISKPVTISVTTFKVLAPDRLYVPGAYQGWSPGTAPFIRQLDGFTYEGYVYMNVGDYFKFTSAPDWDHINYGDAGTSGKLTEDGLAGGLQVNQPGYYKFNVNTKDLTYTSARVESFGLIGTATAGSWDNSTPMTYNETTGVWEVTANLVPGALKFRANNGWDINYGPADGNALNGTLIQTDGAITINDAGTYKVTIDFSQKTDNKYYYTVVKN